MMYGVTGAGSAAAAGEPRPIMPTKAALSAATRERIRMAGDSFTEVAGGHRVGRAVDGAGGPVGRPACHRYLSTNSRG
ncbi:hypothetical protein GCM10017556_27900 [Micromonospora sagamiensis]|nr:hypothetical protein GCM10017556_27900 [Micromonospora sagamiensis]